MSENCCLIEGSRRCSRPASSTPLSRKIEKTIAERSLHLAQDSTAAHNNICAYHKKMVSPTGKGRASRRKGGDSGDEGEPSTSDQGPRVRLEVLPAASLRRIKKYFKVQTRPGLNKAGLGDALFAHISTAFPVNEKEILTYFIYTVKTHKNRLHHQTSNDS